MNTRKKKKYSATLTYKKFTITIINKKKKSIKFNMVNTSIFESHPKLIEAITEILNSIPTVGNAVICADGTCTAGCAAVNFYTTYNPISKACFAASCVCGTIGAAASGTALVSNYLGVPALGFLGSVGARTFNTLGKYTLHMGNVTNGQITNVTEITNLMN